MATKSSLKSRLVDRAAARGRSSPRASLGKRAADVVGYAKENPLTAVAAVGAGVVLTTVFWDDISRAARRGTRRFR